MHDDPCMPRFIPPCIAPLSPLPPVTPPPPCDQSRDVLRSKIDDFLGDADGSLLVGNGRACSEASLWYVCVRGGEGELGARGREGELGGGGTFTPP